MSSRKVWFRVLLTVTDRLEVVDRLAWFLVLQRSAIRRIVAQSIARYGTHAVSELVQAFAMPEPLARFLVALSERDRPLRQLPAILAPALEELRLAGQGAGIQVDAPSSITTQALQSLREALAKQFEQEVIIDSERSDHLLGGVRLTLGTQQIDASVDARLAQLKQRLTA